MQSPPAPVDAQIGAEVLRPELIPSDIARAVLGCFEYHLKGRKDFMLSMRDIVYSIVDTRECR